MNRIFDLRTFVGLALVVLALVASVVTALYNIHRLFDDANWVTHTHEVAVELNGLLSEVRGVEGAQRGFLITGEASYLQPYDAALLEVRRRLERIAEATVDNPTQQARLPELRQLVNARLGTLADNLALRRDKDFAAARQGVLTSAGERQMDALRAKIDEMVTTENGLLRRRTERYLDRYNAAFATLISTGILGLGMVAACAVLLRNSLAERNRAAATVYAERERLRVTLGSIGDGVIATDVEGRVTFLNPIAQTLCGWSQTDAAGQPLPTVFNIVNETTRLTVENPAVRALSEGMIVGLANHTVLIARDGSERAIADSAAPIRGLDGSTFGAVLVFRDVTEERTAERALVASEARKTAILDTALDCMITCDHEGRVVEFNPAAERTFGYRREYALGKELAELIVPPKLEKGHRQGMARYLATGVPSVLNRRLELPARRADGSEFPCELAITQISGIQPPQFTAYLRDITERKQLEESLRKVAADLSEANRRKNEFLATLAHELRNPLAPIRTGLELIKLSLDDRQTIVEVREMMERQTEQMVRLIDDLLDISRITQGKLNVAKSRIELAQVVRSAVEAVRPIIDRMRHRFVVELAESPIYLDADPHRLAQIISNLLNNAAKYTPSEGRIALSIESAVDWAIIRVKDSGLGVPPEMQGKIFDMFAQIDRPLEQGYTGLGIGLTLVKQLTEMHGGTVEVFSEGTNRGSEFVVRLPRASEPTEVHSQTAVASSSSLGRRLRVLVVDDNRPAADSTTKILLRLNYEARTAHDGLEAIEAAAAFFPDVVLMDLGMPNLNGFEAARRMRQEPWGRSIVLVAVTGWGQEADKRRTKEAGFDEHLVKPVDPVVLQQLLIKIEHRS